MVSENLPRFAHENIYLIIIINQCSCFRMVILCLQTKKNSNEVFATFKSEHDYPSPLLMFYLGLRMVQYRGENTLTFSQEKSLRKHADINFDNSSYAFLLNLTFQHLVVTDTYCVASSNMSSID